MVREAFRERGHDAWSCDLLDTEIPGNHIKGDVLEILNNRWDIMIAFPPCTYLSSVQTFLCRKDPIRVMKRIDASKFFMLLYNSNIEKIAVENPTGVMSHIYREPDQVVHPYYFGSDQFKRTAFWLKNLPTLTHSKTNTLFDNCSHATTKPLIKSWVQKSTGKTKYQRTINTPFMPGHERSRIDPFLAKAMAEQWG